MRGQGIPVSDSAKRQYKPGDLPGLQAITDEFVQVVEQAPLAISITDLSANILYVNPAFCLTTGYNAQDVIGKNHSILSYKTTPAQIYQSMWAQITRGQSWQGRLVNRRKDGERYLAEVAVSPMRQPDGAVRYYMGLHRDVTVSHDISTRLANQQVLLESVLNAAPDAIAVLDSEHQVVLDNLAYKTLKSDFGQEPAACALAKLVDLLGDDAVSKLTSRAYAEGQRISLATGPGKPKRWFSCRLTSMPVASTSVDGYFAPDAAEYLLLTLSEQTREVRRQAQQRVAELRRLTAEGETLHAMQETLHAAIHQIQGPMNMLQAAIGMLGSSPGQHPGQDALERVMSQGSKVLDQLHGALPERPQEATQPVNLNQLVHDVSEICTQRLLQQSIDLQLQLTATLPSLLGQPCRLRVALKQLLENAIDAIAFANTAQRQIRISTRCDTSEPNGLVLLLEDSGPGIAQEQRLKAFQPFYSTKPPTSQGYHGIGLSIVQQVISEHTGTVQIQSGSLGGARIRVDLPVRSMEG